VVALPSRWEAAPVQWHRLPATRLFAHCPVALQAQQWMLLSRLPLKLPRLNEGTATSADSLRQQDNNALRKIMMYRRASVITEKILEIQSLVTNAEQSFKRGVLASVECEPPAHQHQPAARPSFHQCTFFVVGFSRLTMFDLVCRINSKMQQSLSLVSFDRPTDQYQSIFKI